MTISIRGIQTVVRNLEKLEKNITTGALKAEMWAGYMVVNEAVRIHDPHVDTGRLKGSIDAVRVGEIVEAGSGVVAGSEVEYAAKHEYQYPYLQPAIEIVRQRYSGMIIEDVRAEL